ncbi:MAG: hypothetical protein IPM63_01980 [Acidobacteriota bacterium]|nr:MAG: hypothetical protein IPM63_01980 [Acidobacteriota bacterium]
MNKALVAILSALFFLSACGSASGPADNDAEQLSPAVNSASGSPASDPGSRFRREIGDSKGVVVLTDKYGEEDTVKIYDKGGAVWYEFSYYDESAFDELESINTDFKPFAFHPDYLLLALRVVGEDAALYEVVVNEESDLRKFVRKDDENLAYESFEDHILTVYAVDFDQKANPLRSGPEGEPLSGNFSKVPIFKPSKVEGDWLEVIFSDPETGEADANSNGRTKEPARGWIRWRDGSHLRIALFYVA